MDKITRVGVDLAKNVMQIHAVGVNGRVVTRKAVSREHFVSWFARLEPCLVAMEACSTAHHWARRLRTLGHEVCLIPPQFAAPYRKGGTQDKNDAFDAEAICEAASRPHMRFVPIKSSAQQSVLVLHRMRTGFVEERTALVNRIRGLLGEFGVFVPQGIEQLRKHFIERIEDGTSELDGPARQALMRGWAQWQMLDEEIAWLERQIGEHAGRNPDAKRCMQMCGVGLRPPRQQWPPLSTPASSETADRWPPGSAPCPSRTAVAASIVSGASPNKVAIIFVPCYFRVRDPPCSTRTGVMAASPDGLSNCRLASATTRPWSPLRTSTRVSCGPCLPAARSSTHRISPCVQLSRSNKPTRPNLDGHSFPLHRRNRQG
ncbi:transposase family protein [Burkholderia pseudomallei]|nr:transposase family protein [Burkholderia pseudomallei]